MSIRWHLSGRDDAGRDFVMGVYPMLQDETCFFLAADFDKTHWQEDAGAVLETCRRMNVPAALERSRSGNGGHVWLFFEEAIPAALARRLGSHILTETMERRPDIGLDSYDRFFPNQDTLPQGGFGNLIALPLQKRPRERGNSVFLDEQWLPYPDQWAFLSTVRKIDRATVEEIVRDAERRGRVVGVRIALADEDDAEPWTAPPSRRRKEPPIAGPLPESLELVLGDQIYIAKDQLPPGLRNRLLRLAAFQNPEFYKAQAMRLPTYDKPRIIACAEDHRAAHRPAARLPGGRARSCWRTWTSTPSFATSDAPARRWMSTFHGELRPEQEAAAERCWPTTRASCPPRPPSERPWLPRGSLPSAASTRWFSCIAANCWNSGWNDCRRFSACRRKRSAGSAAAEGSRPARWMWRSSKAWCARALSRTAWENTAI